MSRSLRTLVVAFSILSSWSVLAAAGADEQAERREAVKQRIAEMKERLQLTPQQEQTIRPLVEAHVAKLREVRSSLGEQPTRDQKRDAARKVHELSAEFSKQVQAQLTPEQQEEWKKLREENRDQLRERVRARRAA